MIEPLVGYLEEKGATTDLIDGIHPGSTSVKTLYERYPGGPTGTKTSWISTLLAPILWVQNSNATQLSFKLRDFLSVLEWEVRSGKRYDLFVGLESVYTIAGIFLKRLRRVKTVVYYVSDYSPNRYTNRTLNQIYLWLDRYCCYHADFIWDVSKAFQPARIEAGLESDRCKPLIHVPNALFPKQICPLSFAKRIPFSLVYAGTLTQWNGPDTAVAALALVRKKFPTATLHIYGTNGRDQARVQKVIGQFKLGGSVVFHGFIGDVVKLSHEINHYMIGLAPYRELHGSHRAYGDATKLRLYMGAGLPVVTTSVPPLGREIRDFGAGLIVKDNPKELAQAIVKILSNDKLYNDLVQKTLQFARNNTWGNTYDAAFRSMRI